VATPRMNIRFPGRSAAILLAWGFETSSYTLPVLLNALAVKN
jgi:hypothetical protein